MLKLLCLLFLVCLPSLADAATWKVVYPKEEFEGDSRVEYPKALLALALSKTNVKHELNASDDFIRQNKALRKLKENIEINVVWSMTDKQREQDLLPIRIPIAKGLIGWRMLFAQEANKFYSSDISSFDDLLAFSPVQGVDWPDTKILQASGFNVVTSPSMLDAHLLLEKGQADFFPRSIIEILTEHTDKRKSKGVKIKPGIIIKYPTAMYYFVNKRNKTLARLIETGLNRAIADGSFDGLFLAHFGEILAKTNLEKAQVFELENPLLPYQTPIFEKHLWH